VVPNNLGYRASAALSNVGTTAFLTTKELDVHTMIVTMTLDPTRPAEVDRHFRQDVAPWAKAQPGFSGGSWLRSPDGTRGLGVVTFTSAEAAASAAVGPRAARPGPAWSIDSVEVFDQLHQV
jgi:hypothetical protein